MDLTLRDGVTLKDAVQQAKAIDTELSENGFDQVALEQAATLGYANSCFEVDGDEMSDVVEEFYPVADDSNQMPSKADKAMQPNTRRIAQGLRQSVTAVS